VFVVNTDSCSELPEGGLAAEPMMPACHLTFLPRPKACTASLAGHVE